MYLSLLQMARKQKTALDASVTAAYLPHRVHLSSQAPIMKCNYTAITPEVVIISGIDVLL